VHQLPALPDKLRKIQTRESRSEAPPSPLIIVDPYRVFFRFRSLSHLAIAVTHDSIFIWDCLQSNSPSSRSIPLPFPLKSSDRLPLACVTSNSSKELGLVIVYPSSGKITFVENIDSAESLKLFDQRRRGVEGTFKLHGGEFIDQIVDTEYAGLILETSTGRLAQLGLQDENGIAKISLSAFNAPTKGSFFGDLLPSFTSSWRPASQTIKSRPLSKGRVQVIILTEEGVFKVWEVTEAGQAAFCDEIDISDPVRDALRQAGIVPKVKYTLQFKDMALLPPTESAGIDCLILATVQSDSESYHVLLEATVHSTSIAVKRVVTIKVLDANGKSQPQLVLPQKSRTIFVVDGRDIAIIFWPDLLEDAPDGPSVTPSHQDVLHLQDRAGDILASADLATTSSKNAKRPMSSIVIYTKFAGILKISGTNVCKMSESLVSYPTAKSKLEQAIYFGGGAKNNPLNLTDLSSFTFAPDDVENAALRISSDVLRASSDYIPQSAVSMDSHLTLRLTILQDLMQYLLKHAHPLSRSTKWKLLTNAERLAAARAVWRKFDTLLAKKDREDVCLLEQAIDAAIERYKNDDSSDMNDVDDVRLWFTKHVNSLERLLPISFGIIKSRSREDQLHKKDILKLCREMNDLVGTTLGAAFDFRQRHIATYGLGDEELDDGILVAGYEGLPKLWTSDADVVKSANWAIEFSRNVTTTFQTMPSESPKELVELAKAADEIAQGMDQVIKLNCRSYVECYRWLMARESPEDQAKGLEMKSGFETKIRRDQIVSLFNMGQAQRGLALAEELEDIPALVDLALQELDEQKKEQMRRRAAHQSGHQNGAANVDQPDGLKKIEDLIGHYFRKFGSRFSKPFYAGQLTTHRLADLIDKDLGTPQLRTQFLRSDPVAGKVSWINEVTNEKSVLEAGRSLTATAATSESNTWAKGIELSLARLALRAVPGFEEVSNDSTVTDDVAAAQQAWRTNKRESVILDAQMQLYNHVRPVILEAVDEDGMANNVMKVFGASVIKRHPALAQLLQLAFSDLVSHRCMKPDSIIDVLTLMDEIPHDGIEFGVSDPPSDLCGREFALALTVLKAAPQPTSAVNRLIWKRCLLRDDWERLSKTSEKSDEEMDASLMHTAAFVTVKHGIATGQYDW
jgi:nuclear pore complex protein Nup133